MHLFPSVKDTVEIMLSQGWGQVCPTVLCSCAPCPHSHRPWSVDESIPALLFDHEWAPAPLLWGHLCAVSGPCQVHVCVCSTVEETIHVVLVADLVEKEKVGEEGSSSLGHGPHGCLALMALAVAAHWARLKTWSLTLPETRSGFLYKCSLFPSLCL